MASLPSLLPLAIDWALARAREVAVNGTALTLEEIQIARRVGVQKPELIRVAIVDSFPIPDDPGLREAAEQTGLLGPDSIGLTLGYAVFLRRGHLSVRLLSHELRHVQQFEAAGSIEQFLPSYLEQIATVGYPNAPFEVDARRYEFDS